MIDLAGLSWFHLAGGVVTLAVAPQRLRAGEHVAVHMPNAVASTDGAVLIAEARRATSPAVSTNHVLSGRVDVTAGGDTLLLTHHQSVTITDGMIGPITTLRDRDVEMLAADRKSHGLRRAESTSGSSSGPERCLGKLYPAVEAEDADSVTSVTGLGAEGGLELPKGLTLPVGPGYRTTPGEP